MPYAYPNVYILCIIIKKYQIILKNMDALLQYVIN